MTIDELTAHVESLDGVLTLRPGPGDGTPELAWGDLFFYYAPDGQVPNGQPFATVVTKDYPGEPSSGLGAAPADADGAFRVNLDAGRRGQEPCADPAARDAVIAHPTYGELGWVAVVSPGAGTETELRELLTQAHADAQRRWDRRHD
jgi:hypothetical protein